MYLLGAPRDARGKALPNPSRASVEHALARFRKYCRFDPITGCVLWVGGKTKGRGHHVDYPSFWYDGQRWFGHRWSARFIHGLDIDGFHVDHCCPNVPLPNTLCVEHVQAKTPRENRELQTDRRRRFIHLQVGILRYDEIYGPPIDPIDTDGFPFFQPPAWLGTPQGPIDESCPF